MNRIRRWPCLTVACFGFALGSMTGCQTWVPQAGLTLPSGRYLEHPPQYLPPSPAFPLTRELANMETINGRAAGAPLPGGLPGPAPAEPVPPPVPAPPRGL
jgi:hypothetical protein